MKRIKYLVFITLFICVSLSYAQVKKSLPEEKDEDIKYVLIDEYPQLGVDFSTIAQLKIFALKNEYRLRDVLIIDIAMLTTSKDEYFFPTIFDTNIFIRNRDGKVINLVHYIIYKRKVIRNLLKDGLETNTLFLKVGCGKEKLDDDLFPADGESKNTFIFNNNLFSTMIDGCINIKKSGDYFIWAEITNKYVAYSPNNKNVKTAIGRIKSNELKLNVKP